MKKSMVLITAIFITIVVIIISVTQFNKTGKDKKVEGINTEKQLSMIQGLILPHHKLAENLIGSSYEKITDKYSYIVIFGTNHFRKDGPTIITATEIPDFQIASDIAQKLQDRFSDIPIDNRLVLDEHSITLQLPYIKNKFPDAKIVPLMISARFGENDLNNKVSFLDSILPGDTLFIASVDFSHNLMLTQALEKNEESIKILQNFDYKTLYTLNDDYMDSPVAIALLLKTMQKRKSSHWETWYSSHAALLIGDQTVRGTSYVIGAYK